MNGSVSHESKIGLAEIRSIQAVHKLDRVSIFSTKKRTTPLHRARIRFEQQLMHNSIGKSIDLLGSSGQTVTDKLDGLLGYKYSIAVENSIHKGYFNDKLTAALLSGCHVFYHGCSTAQDIFNDAITMIDIYSPRAAIETIRASVESDVYSKSSGDIYRAKDYIISNLNIMTNVVKACCQVPAIQERTYKDCMLRSDAECRLSKMLLTAIRR